MKCLRPILSASSLSLLLPLLFLGAGPALQNGTQNPTVEPRYGSALQASATPTPSPNTPSTFEISLAELGYNEQVLDSPFDTIEYSLRLPEGWEIREGSSFELNFSYTYDRLNLPVDESPLSLLGDVIVVIDGETQLVFTIEESQLDDFRLSIELPPHLLNNPARTVHSIEVTLNASLICDIPHQAQLIIHPTSFFALVHDQLPIIPDLARYPRPFYQRAFEPDQVRFVLPAQPTEMELAGAAAVAAKLGDITYGLIISGTTDLELLTDLEAGEIPQEHLILIGRPASNRLILELNQLGVLPVPLKERQLSLVGEGPAAVAPGGALTYILMLTNTTRQDFADLSLVDVLPASAEMLTCSPPCSEDVDGQVNWSIPSLAAGEVLSYTLKLRLSQVMTDSIVQNTVTLLDAEANPINANTLTTRVSPDSLPASDHRLYASGQGGYFAVQGERAVPEHDGIVQELVSPWDQARAILIVTGLNDEAVYKASQAMSSETSFPGLEGPFALVREVNLSPELPQEPLATEVSFADLGYSDRVLRGISRSTNYDFEIPINWQLTEAAFLELHFSNSQLLDSRRSFLSVLLNGKPLASIPLNDENASGEVLKVELLPSQVPPGQRNRISVQVKMQPTDSCADLDLWLLISSDSVIHLDHKEQNSPFLDLKLYPYPFDRRSDLADTLFVLPGEYDREEWTMALQLIAALGNAAGGPNFMPAVTIGENRSADELSAYHLVVLGRPSRNAILQQVNPQLPQPFLPDSDTIEQKLDEVTLRLPPDLSLGYVQLIPSPWDEKHALLAVTGTTDEGVGWAIDVLSDDSLNWQLKGDLTLIRDSSINSLDTRSLSKRSAAVAVTTAIPEMSPEPTATGLAPTPTPTISSTNTHPATPQVSQATNTPMASLPTWIIFLMGFNLVAVVTILAIALRNSQRSR